MALALPAVAAAATGPAETGIVSNSTTLAGATSVAVSGHYAFVTSYSMGQLTAIDISNPASPVVVGATPQANSLVNSTNVTIVGNYAYVVSKNRNGTKGTNSNDDGTGNSLTIVDISNPASPTIVGSVRDAVNLFGSYGIAVKGNYAYVAAQGCVAGNPCPNAGVGNSFAVVDVSNPAAPTIVATLNNNALPAPYTGTNALDHATSVAISGNYAYVTAAYANRLTVIDISNPLAPQIVASIQDGTQLNFDVDVSVQGNYAYVANQSSYKGLAVVDISTPASPKIVGVANSAWLNGAYRVRVHGNFAYVSADYAEAAVAVDVLFPTAPRIAGTLWDPNHFYETTGVEADPTLHYQLMTSLKLSTQSGANYPPYPNQPGGPTVTGTVTVLTLDPSPIGVSLISRPSNPTNQTTASFSFSPTDTAINLSCQLDGAPPTPCTTGTSQTYSGLSAGSHTFVVQVTDTTGVSASKSYTWTVNPPPVNTSPPTISGSAVLGQTLTASPGTWTASPTPTYTYQWEDCDTTGANCTPISGATASTYTLASTDVGSTIVVQVTATNTQGATPASSQPTAVVSSPPANSALPTISGSAVLGQTLTASPGTWTGTPAPTYTYQWQDCDSNGANCTPISGATASTYTVAASDNGFTIEVQVTGTNAAGQAMASSLPTAASTSPPVYSALPTISGSAVVGQALSATTGTWTGSPTPTYAYQWQDCDSGGANCTAISGATGSTYTVASSDDGFTIEVQVTATNTAGQAAATSQPTAVVTEVPANTAAPSISGSAVEGQVLTAGGGSWSGYPAPTLSYQWQRCDSTGASCAPITGASSSTYTVLAADVGSTLTVAVTATNSAGSANRSATPTAVVTSAAGPVTPVLDNFNRPDNTGPPGPSWTLMPAFSSSSTSNLYISSQQITGPTGSAADFWNPQTFGPNSEVYVTVAVKPSVNLDTISLLLRYQNPGIKGATGYQALFTNVNFGPDTYKIVLRQGGGLSPLTLASATGPDLNPGDRLLFRALGTTLELWRCSSGTCSKLLTASDSTIQTAGYLGIVSHDSTVRLDDFGGGTLP